MKQIGCRWFLLLLFACLICVFCSSCKKNGSGDSGTYTPGKTNVLVPEFGKDETIDAGPLTLDFSNASSGYFMGILSQPDKTVNIQVTGPDQVIYKYFINTADVRTVFPFTAGNGTYIILAFEHIGGDQYTTLLSYSLNVEIENEFLPFLYPNQYVDFSKDSEAISLAAQLSSDAETDLDALSAIYSYVTENITYDDEKAATVEAGYLPDIDKTLQTGTGICFDYAALTASMLRALSIPARLDIGYSGDIMHAWIDVYIESIGWVKNAVEFNGKEWKLMDPTFASAIGSDQNISDYIGDGSNYVLQYVR